MNTSNQLLQKLWIDTFMVRINGLNPESQEDAVKAANFAVDEFKKKFNTSETDNVIGSNGLTNPPHAPKE